MLRLFGFCLSMELALRQLTNRIRGHCNVQFWKDMLRLFRFCLNMELASRQELIRKQHHYMLRFWEDIKHWLSFYWTVVLMSKHLDQANGVLFMLLHLKDMLALFRFCLNMEPALRQELPRKKRHYV